MTTRTGRATCTWDGEHWLQPGGETSCTETHCAMRGRCPHHVDTEAGLRTCPSCIGRTRRDIAAIVLLQTLMRYDAQTDGVDSEAMNLIARAAAPEQYAGRRDQLTARYQRRGWCDWPRLEAYADNDRHHPYAVLGRWDQALRDQGYLPQTDLLFTVARGAVDLDRALNGSFPHGDEFEDFAAEIADCRAHLEAVDHDARAAELGRPCPTCAAAAENGKGPRLRKRYAKHPGYVPGQRCDKTDCPTCDGTHDAWHCPADPSHAWTEAEYRARVDADYLDHATELTVADLSTRLEIPQSTIRRWASTTRRLVDGEWVEQPPKIRSARRRQDGRMLYRVSDVLRAQGNEAAS